MENLTINIGWEWALGIFITLSATLIGIAWAASSRFTALETSMDWVKSILKDLKINSDNNASGKPAFATHSPLNLTQTGETLLEESGLKEYIKLNPEKFIRACEAKKEENPYEVQKYIFNLFDQINFDLAFEDKLKKFAFDKGVSMEVLKRVGAIHLRNLCLESFGMKKEDIDKHDPEKIQNQ